MTTPEFVTDSSPVLLSGATGSNARAGGKTATANWWMDSLVAGEHVEYAVAYDPKGGQFVGERVETAEEAAEAVRQGARRIDWTRPSATAGNLDEWFTAATRFADGLPGEAVIVADDAQMYPDSAGLAGAVSMGGNPGPDGDAVKTIVTAQDPWDLPRTAVRVNLNNLGWVGPMTDAGRRYFETFSLEGVADDVDDRHTEPFVWSVWDGMDLLTFDPVPEQYAE